MIEEEDDMNVVQFYTQTYCAAIKAPVGLYDSRTAAEALNSMNEVHGMHTGISETFSIQ